MKTVERQLKTIWYSLPRKTGKPRCRKETARCRRNSWRVPNEAPYAWNRVRKGSSRSSKVVNVDIGQKRVCNFLSVISIGVAIAMGHWGTCPLDFQLFNFSGHFRAKQTLEFDSTWFPTQ